MIRRLNFGPSYGLDFIFVSCTVYGIPSHRNVIVFSFIFTLKLAVYVKPSPESSIWLKTL